MDGSFSYVWVQLFFFISLTELLNYLIFIHLFLRADIILIRPVPCREYSTTAIRKECADVHHNSCSPTSVLPSPCTFAYKQSYDCAKCEKMLWCAYGANHCTVIVAPEFTCRYKKLVLIIGLLPTASLFETGIEPHLYFGDVKTFLLFLSHRFQFSRCRWTCRECRQAIYKGEPVVSRDGRKIRMMYHADCFSGPHFSWRS